MITGGNRPAHRLAGVRELDAHYSSRRAPYDAAGSRIAFARANGTASDLPDAVQAAYDAANEQIQFNSSTPNLTYDANGNLETQTDASGTTTYTWDARNRLVAISSPSVTASFEYDALGRRISKTVNGVKTRYLYDGQDIVQEIGGGAVGASYVRSLNIDEAFVRQTVTGNEFYHADALGSTLDLTNQAGAVQTSYLYEAFGKTTVTGTSSNPFQYTGRENDETRLYYYRARYYSPRMKRFTSEDPLVRALDLIASVQPLTRVPHPYSYVDNSPLNFTDPLGLDKMSEWVKKCEAEFQFCKEAALGAVAGCGAACALGCLTFPQAYSICFKACNLVCTAIGVIIRVTCAANRNTCMAACRS